MPKRIASMTRRLKANGHALHRAIVRRTQAAGASAAPSEEEAALIEERRLLKEEREKRKARALEPRPTALERLVRTHHPEAKADNSKARKRASEGGAEAAKPKARRTRAEKHAEIAAAQEAARHSHRTAAKKPPAK